MITLEIETQFGTIYGTYSGGPYIELSFGQAARPVDVINVFDYEKSEPIIEVSLVLKTVRAISQVPSIVRATA